MSLVIGNNNQLQVNHNARQRSLSPQPRRSRSPVRQQQNTEEMARSRQSLRSQIPSPNAYKSEMFGTSNSLLTLPQPVRSKSVDYSAERIYHSHEKSPSN